MDRHLHISTVMNFLFMIHPCVAIPVLLQNENLGCFTSSIPVLLQNLNLGAYLQVAFCVLHYPSLCCFRIRILELYICNFHSVFDMMHPRVASEFESSSIFVSCILCFTSSIPVLLQNLNLGAYVQPALCTFYIMPLCIASKF